jgi:hypothetical protein
MSWCSGVQCSLQLTSNCFCSPLPLASLFSFSEPEGVTIHQDFSCNRKFAQSYITYVYAAHMVEDVQLQYQADMAKYIFWNGRTSGGVYKWNKIYIDVSELLLWLNVVWQLAEILREPEFWNWAKLYVSLGGSCCCWHWMLLTLPYFLHKFV